METWTFDIAFDAGWSALNRTIVGWKRGCWPWVDLAKKTLNRTIVGWKLERVSVRGGYLFALNRTIVGWKLGGKPLPITVESL